MCLYKYLHEDRVSLLDDGLRRFTQPSEFNDPFEVKPVIKDLGADPQTTKSFGSHYESTVRELHKKLSPEIKKKLPLEKLINTPALKNKFLEILKIEMTKQTPNLVASMQENFSKKAGILSLSEASDNLLMWAHYANDHRGFVVGFDVTHEFFNQKRTDADQLRHLRKIQYSHSRPKLTFSETKSIDELMIKGAIWDYEKEWRMTQSIADADKVLERDIHLFRIPFSAFKSVRIGVRANQQTKQKVLDLLSSNSELGHVKIYQLSIHDSKYELVQNLLDW